MNLAELDRPAGAGEEELETETTGAAGNHSVSDAEKAGTPGADDLETSINMSAAVSDNEEEKQPEELEKKVMMEPQGKHYRIDADITQSALNTFLFGHTYRQPLMILVTVLAIAWPIAVIVKKQGNIAMPLICSLFILIWIPFTTYLRAKNARKLNPIYEQTFHPFQWLIKIPIFCHSLISSFLNSESSNCLSLPNAWSRASSKLM